MGVGFVADGVLVVVLTSRVTPLPAAGYLTAVSRPLLACVPMYLSVAFLRPVMMNLHLPNTVCLAAQIIVGAVVYLAASFVFANANVRELIAIVRGRASRRATT